MRKKRSLIVNALFFAVVLVMPLRMSFAEQAHGAGGSVARASHGAAPASSQRAHRSEAREHGHRTHLQANTERKGKAVTGGDAISKDVGPIDRRLREAIPAESPESSPPRHPPGSDSRDAKLKLKPAEISPRPAALVSPPVTVRNAIGVAVMPSADVGRRSAGPVASSRSENGGSAGVLSTSGGASVGAAKLPSVNASKPVTATAPGTAQIAGSAMIRPALAPSQLGGPAKSLTGINGTTMPRQRANAR